MFGVFRSFWGPWASDAAADAPGPADYKKTLPRVAVKAKHPRDQPNPMREEVTVPFVTVKMLEGRNSDQKRSLAKAITDALEEICGAKPDGTMVVIEEVSRENWARAGVLISDRGAG